MTITEIFLSILFYVVCICIGAFSGKGILWIMREFNIRNSTVENFIKEHSTQFVWYFIIVASFGLFLYLRFFK